MKRKLTDSQIDSLCQGYIQGISRTDLEAQFHISMPTVYNYLALRQIPLRKPMPVLLSKEEQQIACDRYQAGESSGLIADTFQVTEAVIRKYLHRNGIRVRVDGKHQRQCEYDDTFFDTIDTQDKAYWLGFFAADGSINSPGSLSIVLHPKDRNHLLRFSKALQSTVCIKDYVYPYQSFAKFTLRSKRLVSALEHHGITARKTDTLNWPTLPKDMERHFARGYADGDGSFVSYWHSPTSKQALLFSVIGNIPFIESYQNVLISECNLRRTKPYHRCKSRLYPTITYAGNLQLIRIANYLYEGAITYLPRKRDVVMNHYRDHTPYLGELMFR